MPPLFTRFLAERLTKLGRLPFAEATHGTALRPGMGWIAPGDWHMAVRPPRDGNPATLELNQEPPESSCRPAVDPLFRSVATAYGARALGVVLTGMGQDGVRGAEAIVRAGGHVLAQDEATSVVWGMPGFVANAGLADKVLPLELVAPELVRRLNEVSLPGATRAAATSHA
jgi:two-component system chemotaxis response regulator CheB